MKKKSVNRANNAKSEIIVKKKIFRYASSLPASRDWYISHLCSGPTWPEVSQSTLCNWNWSTKLTKYLFDNNVDIASSFNSCRDFIQFKYLKIPDVGRIGWYVVFCSGIEIVFSSVHRRSNTLVTESEVPPCLIHLIERNFPTEYLPAPLYSHSNGMRES